MKRKPYYTLTEAARLLRITRAAVFKAIKAGKLKAALGRIATVTEGWRVQPASLQAYEVSLSHQERGKKIA